MKDLTLTIRLNKELKQQFEEFCNSIGLNITAAFTIFMKQSLREQRIPFEIGLKTTTIVKEDEEFNKILNDISDYSKFKN